jgi:MarR family transcriptional regulator, organic hydroperoxide resistance regulator
VIHEEGATGVILALHRATHATLHALAARLAGLDLPAPDMNALANLADGGRRTVGELARATATKPTTLTSVLDRLARRGLIVRELDPGDRRSFLISLTPGGEAAARTVAAAVHDLERQALATVTEAELAGFRAVARALQEVPA